MLEALIGPSALQKGGDKMLSAKTALDKCRSPLSSLRAAGQGVGMETAPAKALVTSIQKQPKAGLSRLVDLGNAFVLTAMVLQAACPTQPLDLAPECCCSPEVRPCRVRASLWSLHLTYHKQWWQDELVSARALG